MAKVVYNNMVYSSYFGVVDKHVFKERQVAISRTIPQDFNGTVYRDLNPPQDLLLAFKNEEIDELQFKEIYYSEVLEKLDPRKVYENLKGKVICCWCRKGEFCHRRLVLDWLRKEIGKEYVGGEL